MTSWMLVRDARELGSSRVASVHVRAGSSTCAWRRALALVHRTSWMRVRNARELGSSRAAVGHMRAGSVRTVLSQALGPQHMRVAQSAGAVAHDQLDAAQPGGTACCAARWHSQAAQSGGAARQRSRAAQLYRFGPSARGEGAAAAVVTLRHSWVAQTGADAAAQLGGAAGQRSQVAPHAAQPGGTARRRSQAVRPGSVAGQRSWAVPPGCTWQMRHMVDTWQWLRRTTAGWRGRALMQRRSWVAQLGSAARWHSMLRSPVAQPGGAGRRCGQAA
jgi:hypothetical protein